MTDLPAESDLPQDANEQLDGAPAERPAKTAEPNDELAVLACDMAREMVLGRCSDVLVLDVRGLSEVTHFVIIGTGTSDRQIQAVARDLNDFATPRGYERFGQDSDEAATWIVADFIDIMVHLFEPDTRSHFDLEMMWGDAPRIEWEKTSPVDQRNG